MYLKSFDATALSNAQGFLDRTKNLLDDVKTLFFKVGYELNIAVECGYYKELGYSDIYELSQEQFGFEATSTKNLMGINRRFCIKDENGDITDELDSKFLGFSQTALVEMLPLTNYEAENLTPDMTISELRDYKRSFKAGSPLSGLMDYTRMLDNPKETVKQYREAKHAKEVYEARKKAEQQVYGEDIPAGQVNIDDVSEEQFFYNSKTEESQSTDRVEEVPLLPVKPILKRHVFKSNEERRAFIEDEFNYPIKVIENKELNLTIKRLTFSNGAKLYRSEFKEHSFYQQKTISKVSYSLVDENEKEDYNCRFLNTFTFEGVAPTYIIQYMTKHRSEI